MVNFTLKELIEWLGLTTFEIWIHLLSIQVFSVFLALKADQVLNSRYFFVSDCT